MMKRKTSILFILCAIVFLAVLFFSVYAMAAEDTSGYARVYGYKDVVERDDRKFAPYAVLADEAHSKKYSLRYEYSKSDNYTRSWTLYLVNASGRKKASYQGRIDVYIPYPSIWSKDQQAYWKWTKSYAERYDWTITKTMTESPYTKLEEKAIEPGNEFGFNVAFFEGIPGKKVTIKMMH